MADLPDPSTLSDEELDKILAGGDEEPETPDEPDEPNGDKPKGDKPKQEDEEEPEDQPEEDEEPLEEPEKPAGDPEEKKPSRREQMRIRDILQKYGEPEPQPKPQPKTGLDYEKELDADPETIKRLQEDREQASKASYDQGFEQAKSLQFLTRLEIDAPRVEAKYPQLDKNSPEFKADAASDINTLYLTLAGYDPKTQQVQTADIRYASFVDTIFGLVDDLASQKAQDATKNIKKQVAKTGLRPDGSSAKKLNLNKAPEDMSDEELDAYLEQAIPKR